MIDVLAFGGQRSWVDSPKQLSQLHRHFSTSSPYFHKSLETLQKQTLSSPSDCYSFFYLPTALPHDNSLGHLSPQSQTLQLQTTSEDMTQQASTKQLALPSQEDLGEIPLKLDSPHLDAYYQRMSPFMARGNFNPAVSSNGSTYCESELESLGPFEDSFTTRPADAECHIAHPNPKRGAFSAESNIPFLSSNDDATFLPSLQIQDNQLEDPAFSSHSFNVSTPTDFTLGGPLGHTHITQPMTSPNLLDAKPAVYDDTVSWSTWVASMPNYTWCPSRDISDLVVEGSWRDPNSHSASWPAPNTPFAPQPEGNLDHQAQGTGGINGLPVISSNNFVDSLTSPSHLVYQPSPANSALHTGSNEAYPRHYIPNQPTYISSPYNVYSDTDTGSPLPKLPGSLSPPSFTPTSEERSSPRQSGSEQTEIEANMHYSDERNAFLVDCKRRGLSYKDIKRVGGFKEAESTLRGRYRTLTKCKDQRVRKPKWQDKDVRLLCEAVSIHAETPDTYHAVANMGMTMNEPPKVSWKKVAEHIWSHGGTYRFGNATCKKKWCEIHNIRI